MALHEAIALPAAQYHQAPIDTQQWFQRYSLGRRGLLH